MYTTTQILNLLQQLPEQKQLEARHFIEFLVAKYGTITKQNLVKEESVTYGVLKVETKETINREELKQEIDNLPEIILQEVYRVLHPIQQLKKRRVPLPAFDFGGQLDHVNIRRLAYEG